MPAAVRFRPDACPGVFAPHDAADGALARIRLPGGAIDAAALRAFADCADELGDGHLHLTSRGNLQLRGLARSSALSARLMDAGLLPSATHERVRNILASPLAGIASDPTARVDVVASTTLGTRETGSCDVRGLAAALDRGLCARPELAGLPGRFLFALDDGRGDVAAEEPDLCWQAPGRLLVAGLDTGLHVSAVDAVAVLLDAAEAFLALRATDGESAWRAAELADAPARIAAGLTSVELAIGPDCSKVALLQSGCSKATLLQPRTPAPVRAAVPGPVARDDGGVALVVAPLLGELTTAQARLLADAGAALVVTPWRTVVLRDPQVSTAELAAAGLVVEPGPAADVSACAGRPGCAKALADVRADARAWLSRSSGPPRGRPHARLGVRTPLRRPARPARRRRRARRRRVPRRRDRPDGPRMSRSYVRDGAEIYRRSFATIRAEADLTALPPDVAPVAVRMIHACGQVDLVDDLGFSPGVVAAGRKALQDGAPILCDAQMVASGVTRARLPAGQRRRLHAARPPGPGAGRSGWAPRAPRRRSSCGATGSTAPSSRSATPRPRCSTCSRCSTPARRAPRPCSASRSGSSARRSRRRRWRRTRPASTSSCTAGAAGRAITAAAVNALATEEEIL